MFDLYRKCCDLWNQSLSVVIVCVFSNKGLNQLILITENLSVNPPLHLSSVCSDQNLNKNQTLMNYVQGICTN